MKVVSSRQDPEDTHAVVNNRLDNGRCGGLGDVAGQARQRFLERLRSEMCGVLGAIRPEPKRAR